jgi:hypothetical protein
LLILNCGTSQFIAEHLRAEATINGPAFVIPKGYGALHNLHVDPLRRSTKEFNEICELQVITSIDFDLEEALASLAGLCFPVKDSINFCVKE